MILFFAASVIAAKINKLKIGNLFKYYALYPLYLCEIVYLFFQINAFFGNYFYVPYASFIQTAFLMSLFFPIFAYKLYKPAVAGATLTIFGTILNKIVMSANNGKMPVLPSLSILTGYYKEGTLGSSVDNIHILLDSTTKLNFLADYIDIGFSIMSVGDIFIHSFMAIIIYYSIKSYSIKSKNQIYNSSVIE